MIHIYTMDYYSAIRKDKILPFVTICMDLESIMLSKVSQTESRTIYFTHMWDRKPKTANEQTRQTKPMDRDNSMVVTRGRVGWGRE